MTDATLMTGQTDTAPDAQPAAATGTAPDQTGSQNQQQAAPATGQQPATGQTPAAPQDAAKPAPPKAPDTYGDFTVPEGYALGEMGDTFKALAKDLNLTQEQAQKVIDLDVARAQKHSDALKQAATAWQEASAADQEFGGEHLGENMALARKALDTFGSPELKTLLDSSGLGNHPEIIRAFYRAGKAISEDRLVTGAPATGQPGDARKLYAASGMNP